MLPMLQTEPVVFGSGGGGGASASAAAGGHPGPLAPIADLLDDSGSLFCEADVGFDPFHIPGIGSCELQLGDTWGGMQSKMSAVAPVKKIRKKSDSKPQSQINKCNNEKRRRELENETINQLEELLGACLSDVKQPDKNGIVQEAAAQIRLVLERRRESAGACCGSCPPRCRQHCPTTPVQAGEVSSTQHAAHDSAYYSEITTLIEALKHYTTSLGWVLLEINCDGDIECVTENIKDIISWDRSELYKQNIYTYLHHGDHHNFTPILQNVQAVGWPAVDTDKFRAIRSRLLVKGATPAESTGFVEVLIHAAGVRGGAEEPASVMCVIRRCDDATPGLLPVEGGPPTFAQKQPHQITFKLDRTSKIITCDLTGVGSPSGSPACLTLEGVRLVDLVDPGDRVLLVTHLRDSPQAPSEPSVSAPFRLRVGLDKTYITVRAESRLFRNSNSQEGDFVMSTHSILSEEEVANLGAPAATPPVGGPLMTSVANGGTSDARFRPTSPAEPFALHDFEAEFPQASWDYMAPTRSPSESFGAFPFDELPSEDTKRETPTEPLRGATEEPNRLRSLLSKKPESDGGGTSGTAVNNRILKDLLKQEDEECGGSESTSTSAPLTPHTPAAALSPQAVSRVPPPTSTPTTPTPAPLHNHNNSDMLLRILNEKSDDDNEDSRHRDANRSTSQPSALLTQLLANGPETNSKPRTPQDASDNFLDRFIGGKRKAEETRPGPPSAKRSTPEAQQVTSSAVATSSAAGPALNTVNTSTGTGMSALCQKNKILVSLLARQQSTPTTPLPSPNPSLQPFINGRPRLAHPPTPQSTPRSHHHSTLTNMLSRATSVNGGSPDTSAPSQQSHLQMVLQGSRAYPTPAYSSNMQHHFRLDAPTSPKLDTGGIYRQEASIARKEQVAVLNQQKNELVSSMASIRCSRIKHWPSAPLAMMGPTGSRQQLVRENESQPTETHVTSEPEIVWKNKVRLRTEPLEQISSTTGGGSVPPSLKMILTIIAKIQKKIKNLSGVRPVPIRAPGSGGDGTGPGVEMPNDQMLSDLLDDVINNELEPRQLPDMHLFNMGQGRTDYAGMKEKMDRINAITQSLMQVEKAVKSPSPGVSPAYSAQSPQGAMYGVSGHVGSATQSSTDLPPLGVGVGGNMRARISAEQQRARLLLVQRTQAMLVPQGAEQAPGDLNNTIEALVNSSTPPNVTLTRTDYHHNIYHPSSQVGSTYGTNKITSQQQQNPMLSAQLTSVYAQQNAGVMHTGHQSPATLHSPHTPHTPLSPHPHTPLAPYHQRPARPHHMGGYYPEVGAAGAAGYCVDYARRAAAPPHQHEHALSCGGSGGSAAGASEYVRQEIRAVVGARARPDLHHPLPHPPDLESLGLSFEMPSAPGGGSVVGGRGASATTNSWESHQSTPTSTGAGAAEEAAQVGDEAAASGATGGGATGGGGAAAAVSKASLLQKLLSE